MKNSSFRHNIFCNTLVAYPFLLKFVFCKDIALGIYQLQKQSFFSPVTMIGNIITIAYFQMGINDYERNIYLNYSLKLKSEIMFQCKVYIFSTNIY